MSERLVKTVRTTPTMKEFWGALLQAWPEASREGASVLWSHFAAETGSGKHCYNFNLGNYKHVRGDGHDYVSLLGVWEGFRVGDEDRDGDIDEDDRRLLIERLSRTGAWKWDPSSAHQMAVGKGKVSMIASPQNPATWFRAYTSLEEGMRAFVDQKRKPGQRYSSAWPYIERGDAEGYAHELGRKGYYTASPAVYARALLARQSEWLGSNVGVPPEPVVAWDVVHPDVPLGRET